MFEEEVRDFEEIRDQLKTLLSSNPAFVTSLVKTIQHYNVVTKELKDKVYAESKSTGKTVYAGPFSSETGKKTEYDFDAIENLIPLEEFKEIVDIKYTLRKGSASKLEAIIKKEPKVKAHIHQVVGSTLSHGPKPIDGIDELEGIGCE